MKAGGYTLHQSLTLEAAAVVKQALNLARRRGHAQVTPLHVASSLLASSTGLLKRACLQSHSHPLQCKALELCFNVALNRLPTSASTPLLAPHCHIPSLSNALVAAFKRAQAHQRRGSIESQQQSILALKVEIEQLVISILDDPSVSRVMREAGFSSTQVKANVEKTVSIEKCNSRSPSVSGQSKDLNTKSLGLGKTTLPQTPTTSLAHFTLSLPKTDIHAQNNDDVMSILKAMMDKKTKNTVIVAESLATAESLVRKVIQTFNKKDVPANMRSVQFISVPLFTLRDISREEFEIRLGELRSLVKSYMSRGVVLYLGDLDWVASFWSKHGEQRDGYYCPVEYMIMELSKMMCGEKEDNKGLLWLMGTATPQTYAKCKIGRPSLETLWCLHSLRLPVDNLALNLSLHSAGMYDRVKEEVMDDFNLLFQKAGIKKQLICCSDCSENFKKEAQSVLSAKQEVKATASSSSLPSWLQQYMVDNRKHDNADQDCDKIKDICKKWNSICSSVHRKAPHFLFNLSSSSPPSSTSTSSNGHNKPDKLQQSLLNWPVIVDEPILEPNKHRIFIHENDVELSKPSFSFAAPKPDLLSNPNSSPNSASSSEASQEMDYHLHKFKEFSSDNLNVLSSALEKKVPWQSDIIPEIVSTILKCKSGMMRSQREDCWLFFLGADCDGKEIVARELAKAMFGSHNSYIAIGISSFSLNDTTADLAEEVSNKRARNEHGGSSYDRFWDAMRDNPRRVFYIEDVDQMEYSSLKGFKRAIGDGSVALPDGEIVLLRDAIVIFSSENFSSESRASSLCRHIPSEREDSSEKGSKEGRNDSDDEQHCETLDLNVTATGEDNNEDDEINSSSVIESGILELVDKQVVFTIQVL